MDEMFYVDFIYINFTESFPFFYSDSGDINVFCGINGCEDTNRNACLYTSFSEGISLPCATTVAIYTVIF